MTGIRIWLTAGLRLWRRVVRTRPAIALAMFVVTFVAAVLVTSGARLLDRVSSDDLMVALDSAEPRAANIQYVSDGRIGVGSEEEPLLQIADRGDAIFDDELPESIREIISDQQFVIESPPFRVSSFPDQDEGPFTRTLRFRFQSELDEHLAVVEGRAPAGRELRSVLLGSGCPPDMSAVADFEPADDVDCRVTDVPVYEVAATARTLEDLMVNVGDTVVLRPELTHLRWAFIRAELLDRVILVDIVGELELTDPSDDYWFGDDSLHRPRVAENPDFRLIFASAVTPDVDYRPMVRDIQDVHFDFAWRYRVDPERIDQTEAADLAAEIGKLGSDEDQVVTLIPEIVAQHLGERALAVGLMSTSFAGVLVVAAAAAFVLASLSADRQHHSIRLLLDRGVGRGGLRWTGLWHGLVVALPAVVLALVVAGWLIDEGRWSRPFVAGAVLTVAVVGAVAAAVWLATNRAAGQLVESLIASARRVVRDAALLILAVGAVVLVRRRAEFDIAAESDLDLLLAVAPPLVGLAAGVVTIRLMAPLFGGLAALGRRLRGMVPFVGFRRLINQGRAARSAVAIVVLAVGMAGFATTTTAAVDEAQMVNGWQLVGADLALRGQTLDAPVPPPVVELASARSSTVVAGFQQPSTGVIAPAGLPAVELMAVDTGGYRSLLAESPLESTVVDLLIDADEPAGDEPDGDVIPAVVSGSWTPADRPGRGDRIDLQMGTTRIPLEVVGVVGELPASPAGRPGVLVDLERLRAAGPPSLAPSTVLFVSTDDDPEATAALRAEVAELDSTVRIADRFEHLDTLAADPFVRWTDVGMRLLTGFAVALAVLSVVSALAISAPTRQRDLGLLTTMGLGSRQAALVTTIEQLVPIVVAVLAGAAVAAALVRLIVPALNLTAFSGGPLPVEVGLVDSGTAVVALIAPAVAVVGAVFVAVLVSTWWLVGRRVEWASRMEFE